MKTKSVIISLFFLSGSFLMNSCKHDLPADAAVAATTGDDHGGHHGGDDDDDDRHINNLNLSTGNTDTLSLQNGAINK